MSSANGNPKVYTHLRLPSALMVRDLICGPREQPMNTKIVIYIYSDISGLKMLFDGWSLKKDRSFFQQSAATKITIPVVELDFKLPQCIYY